MHTHLHTSICRDITCTSTLYYLHIFRSHDFTDIVVIHEHRGEPDGMVVCHLPFGPTAYFGIHGTVLRHDIGQKKEVGDFYGSVWLLLLLLRRVEEESPGQ